MKRHTRMDETLTKHPSLMSDAEILRHGPVFEWETVERHQEPKSGDWHSILWIVGVSACVGCAILGNWILGLLILSITFCIFVSTTHPVSLIECSITPDGVRVDKTLYPYKSLDSFTIDMQATRLPKLVLKSKKTFMPLIIIPIQNENPRTVEDAISFYLPEGEHPEPLTHKIMEYIGF